MTGAVYGGSRTMRGTGNGPTVAELARFIDGADPAATVVLGTMRPGAPMESPTWSMTMTEPDEPPEVPC